MEKDQPNASYFKSKATVTSPVKAEKEAAQTLDLSDPKVFDTVMQKKTEAAKEDR